VIAPGPVDVRGNRTSVSGPGSGGFRRGVTGHIAAAVRGPHRTEDRGMTPRFIPAAVEWACERRFLYVRLSGEIDAAFEQELSAVIERTAGHFRRAFVDLNQVTFFGATGLNFLSRLAGCGGAVQLIGVPEGVPIRRQLRAAGLERVIDLEPSVHPETVRGERRSRAAGARIA
jgi:anti-anti-sigma factor